MIFYNKSKAFTLVELIVVITILSVLATVAFISFQGYAASSRDSVRLSDIKSMEKVINLYRLTNSKYPTPNAETSITYSGSTAWIQGVFGTNSYTKNTNLSDVPLDPITQLPYAYSVTNRKNEYQIAAVLEGEVSNSSIQTYAGTQVASVYVKGDYNGKILRVRKDTTDYILGVPSIIASDINDIRLENILQNQKLVFKGYNNLPASYSGSIYDTSPANGFAFEPSQVILFEGNIDELESNLSQRTAFLDNLQTNYSGTIIAGEGNIAEILAVDSSSNKGSNLIATTLNNTLKTNIKILLTETISNVQTIIANPDRNYITMYQDETNLGFSRSNGIRGGVVFRRSSGDSSDTSEKGFHAIPILNVKYKGVIYPMNSGPLSIVSDYGTLRIESDGYYEYRIKSNIPLVTEQTYDIFQYTVINSDIDNPETATTTLTIYINPQ